MLPQYERVFTVNDYWDGPRAGIANFHGEPHAFQREVDADPDEYSDIFRLNPIDQRTLELALEQWAIWSRWKGAFDRKEVALESHPRVSHQPARFMELDEILKPALEVPLDGVAKAIGEFRRVRTSSDEWLVCWRPIAQQS